MMYDNSRPNSTLSTTTRWFGAGLFLAAILLYLFLPFISFSPKLLGSVSFGEITVSGADLITGRVSVSGLGAVSVDNTPVAGSGGLLGLGNGSSDGTGLGGNRTNDSASSLPTNGSGPSGLPVVMNIVGGVLIIPAIIGLLMAAPSRARTRAVGTFTAALIGLVLIVATEVVFNLLATHYINQAISSDPSQSGASEVMTVIDQAIGPGTGFWATVATLSVLAAGALVAMITMSRQRIRPQYPVGYGPAPAPGYGSAQPPGYGPPQAPGYGPAPGYPPAVGYPYQPGQAGSSPPDPY